MIEKDYWVTYVLQELKKSEFGQQFVFKGGTSLSKGWDLIDRFSEDVDLLILGEGLARTARKNLLKKIQTFVSKLPGLKIGEDNPDNRGAEESRTSCFEYETKSIDQLTSLLPYIKLEMGFRGGKEPQILRPIQSIIASELQQKGQAALAENITAVDVAVLHPKRTLVEKLFAIYSAYESGVIIQKVRHYYDVYRLLGDQEVVSFFGTDEYMKLKEDVAKFSVENWPGAPVPKDNILSNAEAFQPTNQRLRDIQHEYERSDLYFSKRPKFEEIVARIGSFRNRF